MTDETTPQLAADAQTQTDAEAPNTIQPGLMQARINLMHWPDNADPAEVQAIIDTDFVLAYNAALPAQWQAWQARRLADLMRWITQNLWWQQWTGLSPDSGKSLPLSELPITTRKHMREAVANTQGQSDIPEPPSVPVEHGGVAQIQTSGTSGSALTLWLTEFQARLASAHYRANHYQQGRDPARAVGFISDKLLPHPQSEFLPNDSFALLGENCFESQVHWSRSWAHASPADHAAWLSVNPVPYLSISPHLLTELLDAFELDASIARPAIEQIVSSGGAVDAGLRARARAVLGARIADAYTCEEIGPIAFQCPHSNDDAPHYHLAVTNAVVQIVREDKGKATKFGHLAGEGEFGRVILTGLHQFASPILRVETGDFARIHGQCPVCGALVPTLSELRGPKRLRLQLPNGERLPHQRLSAQDWREIIKQASPDDREVATVLDARLLQAEAGRVRVELVLGGQAPDGLEQAVQLGLAQRISDALTYELHVLPKLDWPVNQMRHPIESLLREHAPQT